MRLDSARELKQMLIEQILSQRAGGAMPRAEAAALSAINLICHAGRQASLAMGISRKSGSPNDFRLAIRIQQRPLENSPVVDMLHKRAHGEADIRYIGRVRPGMAGAGAPRRRERPLVIGASISHPAVTAGTLGCFVKDRRGRVCLLSNNHVIANENAAKTGDPIVQPGTIDGGRITRDTVARVERFIRLRPGQVNRVDAAIATLGPKVRIDPGTLRGLGRLRGVGPASEIGEEVAKIGRTTGLTRGRVSAIELDNVFVDYGIGRVRFDDQLEIEGHPAGRRRPGAFSLGGDSGALIVSRELEAAAILFAGSDHGGPDDRGLTYATPITAVLKALRVKLHVG